MVWGQGCPVRDKAEEESRIQILINPERHLVALHLSPHPVSERKQLEGLYARQEHTHIGMLEK